MNRIVLAAALAAAPLLATPAGAATTTVASGTRGATIGSLGPIGQSFTPTEGLLTSFGFQFAVANPGQADAGLTFSLLQGAGLGGPVVATRSVTVSGLTGRTPVWYDFDLGGAAVTADQSYTALLSAPSTRLALIFGPNLGTGGAPASGDAYAAGALLSTRPIDAFCTTSGACDANFRFTTAAAVAPVPEPASWAMMLAGFAAVGTVLRRGRRGGVANGALRRLAS